MVNMTKIREKSHVFMWILLVFFLLSMTVGGLVGGANIVDNIKGLFTGEKKDTVMKIVDSSSNKSMYNKIDESLTKKDIEYFKKNRRYPEKFDRLVFESSKQCYLKVIAK